VTLDARPQIARLLRSSREQLRLEHRVCNLLRRKSQRLEVGQVGESVMANHGSLRQAFDEGPQVNGTAIDYPGALVGGQAQQLN
jgi:hypothetical protein